MKNFILGASLIVVLFTSSVAMAKAIGKWSAVANLSTTWDNNVGGAAFRYQKTIDPETNVVCYTVQLGTTGVSISCVKNN